MNMNNYEIEIKVLGGLPVLVRANDHLESDRNVGLGEGFENITVHWLGKGNHEISQKVYDKLSDHDKDLIDDSVSELLEQYHMTEAERRYEERRDANLMY